MTSGAPSALNTEVEVTGVLAAVKTAPLRDRERLIAPIANQLVAIRHVEGPIFLPPRLWRLPLGQELDWVLLLSN